MGINYENLFPTLEQIPEKFLFSKELHQKEILINGEFIEWNGLCQNVYSPIYIKKDSNNLEQMLLGSFPQATEKEALMALEAANNAYNNGRGEWPTMTVSERISCMENFTRQMIQKKEEVVNLLMWEIGKSYNDSVKEFDRTVDYIFNTIDALKETDREASRFIIKEGVIGQIRRAPLGVVLCMGPFNYPLNETYTLLIPALLMGNTVLFKPPKHGSLLHFPLYKAFKECFPKGVFNTVYGKGHTVIPPLMASGKVNVLTLIGSSKVADRLKKLHPKVNRLRAILGLDAKNAAIVLPCADIDLAVKECVLGALSFNGQRCTAIKIIFVHATIVNEFTRKFAYEVSKLKLGMPWESDVHITPLPEPEKPDYIKELIEDATSKGAHVINENGGTVFKSFVYPAVLYPVNDKMRIYREEQFGPLVPISNFLDLEEPIQYLITSDHGQQVSIFGTNQDTLAKLIDPLVNQVCRVNINSQCQRGPDTFPFTGRKDSAEGTLSVYDALRSFSIRTMVAAKENNMNKRIINGIVEKGNSKFLSTRFIF